MRGFVIAVLAMVLASASALAFVQCNFDAAPPVSLPTGDSCVIGMSAMSNAHASTCGPGSYAGILKCTSQVTGCSLKCKAPAPGACLAGETSFITLSAATNAHVAQSGQPTSYANNVCCRFTDTADVSCGTLDATSVQLLNPGSNNDCATFNPNFPIEILRMNAPSNAHVEKNTSTVNSQNYAYALCAQLRTECNDQVDNDGDGFVDSTGIAGAASPDPGCLGPYDPSEFGTAQCDDGIDNDNDGFVDYRRSGGDPGCVSPTDDDEMDTSVIRICEADCTYVTDTICHADCAGRNGCGVVAPACDARQVGGFIPIDASTFGVCCSGTSQPAMSGALTYETDRDRVRATRVQQTTTGASVIITVVNFK